MWLRVLEDLKEKAKRDDATGASTPAAVESTKGKVDSHHEDMPVAVG